MKKACGCVVALMMVCAQVCDAAVRVVEDGKAAAVVVTADEPTGTASYAADELIDHVEQATGARLPLANESQVPDGYASRIYVGMTQAARAQGIDAEALGPDEFILRTLDGDLYVLGMEDPERDLRLEEPRRTERHILDTGDRQMWPISKNGTLFGVYEILDRYVGVRWLWPGKLGTYVPSLDRIVIEETLDELHEPALKFRRFRWWGVYRAASRGETDEHGLSFSEDGAVSYWRDLGVFLGRHRLGQSEPKPPVGHYFSGWWPRYGQEHPEWFRMDADGNRGVANPDERHVAMCLSNPDLHRYLVEEAWDGGDVLRLGGVDRRSPGECHCEDCLAWDAPQPETYPEGVSSDYEPRMVSDRYARFWKTIQELAAERNPDVTVTTFLYWNYFPAPLSEIELNDQIYGEFVPWTGESAYYPMSEEIDQWVREQWKRWDETGIRLAYRPNLLHGGYVMPDLATWQAGEFFRFAYQHGMEGIDFDSLYGHWATRGPMLYMYMRLAWKPEMEIERIREEYFAAFGPAAADVETYFDYWEDYSAVRPGGSLYHGARRAYRAYPEERFDEGAEMLERALEAAQSSPKPEYAQRVEFLQAGLEHARLSVEAMSYFDEGGNPPVFPSEFAQGRAALERLIEFRQAHEHRYISDFRHASRKEGDVSALLGEHPAEALPEYVRELSPRALSPGTVLDEAPGSVTIRNEATYLLDATAGEAIELQIHVHQLGSQPGDLAYVLISPTGEVVEEAEVPKGERRTFTFEPQHTGTYAIVCAVGRNAVNVTSTGRLSILHPEGGRLRLFVPRETLYFLVPAGVDTFNVEVEGRGDWAHASAAIMDADGEVVEAKDNITGVSPHTFAMTRDDATRDEVWAIRFSRPSGGYYQDFYFSLSESLPPLLSPRRETLLVPER